MRWFQQPNPLRQETPASAAPYRVAVSFNPHQLESSAIRRHNRASRSASLTRMSEGGASNSLSWATVEGKALQPVADHGGCDPASNDWTPIPGQTSAPIVALARKLLVAFWKYATPGVVIEGAVIPPEDRGQP